MSKSVRISLLILLLSAFSASAQKFFTDIRQVDFKNFTYTLDGEKGKESRKLTDGRHEKPDGAWAALMRITYGDLTGDESAEAVVLIRGHNTRISRGFDEIFIYTLKDGKVVELDHFEAGKRGDYVLSIESLKSNFTVADRSLVLDHAVLRTGEHFPSHYFTVKYRWNGVQMAEVERSALKPLPEGMREVG